MLRRGRVKFFSFARRVTVSLKATGAVVAYSNGIMISRPSIITLSQHASGVVTINRGTGLVCRGARKGVHAIHPLHRKIVTSFCTYRRLVHKLVGVIRAKDHLFSPSLEVVVKIPSNSARIRLHTIHSSTRRTNKHSICLVCRPVTTTVKVNVSIRTPRNGVVISVNNKDARVTIVSLNKVISGGSVHVTKSSLATSVRRCVHERRGIGIDRHVTRHVGVRINTTLARLKRSTPRSCIICNPGYVATLPVRIPIYCRRITRYVRGSVTHVRATMLDTLRGAPPRLCTSVIRGNVCLANKNTLLEKLSGHLASGVGVPFRVTRSPLRDITGKANVTLGGMGGFSFLV